MEAHSDYLGHVVGAEWNLAPIVKSKLRAPAFIVESIFMVHANHVPLLSFDRSWASKYTIPRTGRDTIHSEAKT